MTLHEIADKIGTGTFSGVFALGRELREHLDEEVVATFCREVCREIDSHGMTVEVPKFNVQVAKTPGKEVVPNAFKLVVAMRTKGFERFVSKFFFVEEGGQFSIRRDLQQLSLV